MTVQPIRIQSYWSRTLLTAAVVAGLVGALFSPLPSPVAADAGIHLVDGPADAAGCPSLEVWDNDQLVVTIPADDGPDPFPPYWGVNCARNDRSALLSNGRLIFDWIRWARYTEPFPITEIWAADGTVAGTQRLASSGGFRCGMSGAPYTWEVVGRTAFISSVCPAEGDVSITATRGTPSSTLRLRGQNPGAGMTADGTALPLYAVVGNGIVYAASNLRKGRELWVSNGTQAGTYLLRDIRVGRRSSDIRVLVSDGRVAVFTADDGSGRALWVSNGTWRGTHPVR